MKRLIALGALMALCVFASLASADVFRAPKTVGWTRFTGTGGCASGCDSNYIAHTGAEVDTTDVFGLEGRSFAPYVLGADSLQGFDAAFAWRNGTTAQAVTAATDSIYVTLQGSIDGNSWDSGVQVGILENNNGSGLTFLKGFSFTRLGSVTVAAATNKEMGIYNFFRFIVTTSAASKGRLYCYVSWWKTTFSPQW